ncbi:hypothetical protein F8388_021222 [Cannabis sativa]|uniref:Uncharacterized protein n=1 Tax=Cannabis sativa TaxID=3483 RepID=A0A7J6GFB4_CANSA|nr:hypothetical protein F8388_021222 [Cannabis sativa]KAF4399895.1 hypothetical protein G4B88_021109 [Cannabis sativa]
MHGLKQWMKGRKISFEARSRSDVVLQTGSVNLNNSKPLLWISQAQLLSGLSPLAIEEHSNRTRHIRFRQAAG